MHRRLGGDYLLQVGMPCCDHCKENNQAGARSQHVGGVNMAMADGAVRFVTDQVDIGLWHVMHSRFTPKETLADRLDERLDGSFAVARSKTGSSKHPPGPRQTVTANRLINSIGGVHDMCGSVFEWVNDWLTLDYYSRSPREDPQGPETGYVRVVRGWYWLFTGPACVANMSPPPWSRSPYVGFRVVCQVEPYR